MEVDQVRAIQRDCAWKNEVVFIVTALFRGRCLGRAMTPLGLLAV
jgi:hypothetical protein